MNVESGRPSGRSARTRPQASAGQTPPSGSGQRESASDEDAEPQPAAQASSPSTFIRRFGGQEQQWDGSRAGDSETRENAES